MPTLPDRTQAKALRLLELSYQLLLAYHPMSAGELRYSVLGYDALETNNAKSKERTFERDKDDLLAIGIPIKVVPLPGAGDAEANDAYVADRKQVILAAPIAVSREWAVLTAAAPLLQQVADALPTLDARMAAEAALGLLPFKRDLGIRMSMIDIPPLLRIAAEHMVDWVCHLFVDVVRHGVATGMPNMPVTPEVAGALIGLDPEIVWTMVGRANDRPPNHQTNVRQRFRIELPPGGERTLTIVAPRLDRPWRPRAKHVEALFAAGAAAGVTLPTDASEALWTFRRSPALER